MHQAVDDHQRIMAATKTTDLIMQRIADKSDIYGDAYAWMRIYSSNTDQIKDPDMIHPDQIFRIPRDVGPNEHLVQKGEFL